MKFSAVLLAAMIPNLAVAADRQISNPSSVRKLLSRASSATTTTTTTSSMSMIHRIERRLADDDGGGDDAYDDAFSAEGIAEVEEKLMDYSLKLLKCEAGESVGTDDNGNKMYGVAIVRACPKNSCSSSKQGGCTTGHADFAVPLGDFVEAYLEDQADNMNWDDQMDASSFAQCAEYDDQSSGTAYYVGPSCTSNGKDIQLALFSDAYCLTPADTTFEKVSNGLSLPFSSGGLVSKQCLECGYKGDDGANYLKDMCAGIYEDAALHCEDWDISHYYWDSITEVYRFGRDTTGCKRIAWMDKSPEPFSEWASIFALALLVVGSICGAVWYTLWWKKQKQNLEKIDDEEDDEHLDETDLPDGEYHQHDEEEEDGSAPSGILMGWFT